MPKVSSFRESIVWNILTLFTCVCRLFFVHISESLPGYIKGIKLQPDHQYSKQFARPPWTRLTATKSEVCVWLGVKGRHHCSCTSLNLRIMYLFMAMSICAFDCSLWLYFFFSVCAFQVNRSGSSAEDGRLWFMRSLRWTQTWRSGFFLAFLLALYLSVYSWYSTYSFAPRPKNRRRSKALINHCGTKISISKYLRILRLIY